MRRPGCHLSFGGRHLRLLQHASLAQQVLDGSLVVSVEEAAAAVRVLVERNRVVAEGAGAVPVAAALAGRAGGGNVVCVVSGGNIDPAKLAAILGGGVP